MGLETHIIGYAALFYEIRIAGREFILGNIHAKKKDQISPKELEIIKGKIIFIRTFVLQNCSTFMKKDWDTTRV